MTLEKGIFIRQAAITGEMEESYVNRNLIDNYYPNESKKNFSRSAYLFFSLLSF